MPEQQKQKTENNVSTPSVAQSNKGNQQKSRNHKGKGHAKNKNKRKYRQRQCPYCYEKVDIERKGSLLICYTCGNDSSL